MYHENPSKAFPDALAALCAFHELYPDIPVTIFGVGERGAKIPPWITYHRDPSQEELVRIYNSGTVYLAASRFEGWALPPAEAIACGCAFVGTDIGGFSDYAVHEETALLSPAGNPEGLLAKPDPGHDRSDSPGATPARKSRREIGAIHSGTRRAMRWNPS